MYHVRDSVNTTTGRIDWIAIPHQLISIVELVAFIGYKNHSVIIEVTGIVFFKENGTFVESENSFLINCTLLKYYIYGYMFLLPFF